MDHISGFNGLKLTTMSEHDDTRVCMSDLIFWVRDTGSQLSINRASLQNALTVRCSEPSELFRFIDRTVF